MALQRVVKMGQSVGGRAPHGQGAVVLHEPAECALHPVKSRGNLHQLAQLDSAAEKARSRQDEGKNHRRLAEEAGEPHQPLLRADELKVITHHAAEPQVQLLAFHACAAVKRDGFTCVTHPHHVVPEVGLQPLLFVVEFDLGFAYIVRDDAAHHAVQHRHPDHKTRNGVRAALHLEAEGSTQSPQDADKTHECDHSVEQAHRQRHGIGRELVHVFLDTLVRVVGAAGRRAGEAGQLHAVERIVAQPALQILPRHPGPPVHLQQLREVKLVDRDDDESKCQVAEAAQLLPEHHLVLVLQRVVEHAVPVVEQHQHVHSGQVQHHDGRQQAPCLPFFFRPEIGRGQCPDFGRRGLEAGEFTGRIHGGVLGRVQMGTHRSPGQPVWLSQTLTWNTPPKRLRRFPLKGAHLVAWQSQFHGCSGKGMPISHGVFHHPVSSFTTVGTPAVCLTAEPKQPSWPRRVVRGRPWQTRGFPRSQQTRRGCCRPYQRRPPGGRT